ncbi:MAG TPA: mechanosensitive ion channel family protein [Acidobacteriota bacterium]|nr:mechanosensitive ion channel family protein [Acidobacteriota bacterium]
MSLEREVFGQVTILDLLIATGVLLAAIILSKGLQVYLTRSLAERLRRDHIQLIAKVVYYVIVVVAILVVLSVFGIDPSGLLVAGGIVGIVFGFASQSIVANLISGLFLLFERPVKIGEQVSIGEVSGFVEDINIISTTIRKYDGLYVRIPNEKVFTANITNYVSHVARRFEYVVGIRYSDDADQAIRIVNRVIDNQPFALKEPAPQVFVDSLGDNCVNIMVRVWAPVSEWYSLKMKLLWMLKTALEGEGIEIAFPQRVVWYGDRQLVGESQVPSSEGPKPTRDVAEPEVDQTT